MEIGINEFYSIFQNNFDFPIVDTVIGKAVKMDWLNAFLFANVTGSGYFDNPTLLFSPKGTQKVLREAFQYNTVTGMYDGCDIFCSPSELQKRKPYVFCGDKYIIAKAFDDECALIDELENDFDRIIAAGEATTDYIIARIETSKTGNGMEPFLEYLTCEHFKKQGYVVENQVPLSATVGSPDFGGYKLKEENGFHIIELSLIRITKNFEITNHLDVSHVIVGEAKTSTKAMEKQLRKYLNTGLFARGYEIHPDKADASIPSFGLINVKHGYRISVTEPHVKYNELQPFLYNEEQYAEWITGYFKYLLLANLTNEELHQQIKKEQLKLKITADDLHSFIIGHSIKQIIDIVKEVV